MSYDIKKTELMARLQEENKRLRAALENVARTAGQSDTRGDYIKAVSLIGDLEQMADKALQGKDYSPAPDADPEVKDPDLLREEAHERRRLEQEYPGPIIVTNPDCHRGEKP